MAHRGVWKESFRVRAYETDPTGRASIVSLPVTVSVDFVSSGAAIFAHALRSSHDGRYLAGLSTTWREA
jgi:hypothetical protein